MARIAAQGQHGPEMVERALDLFDRALKIDPEYPPALFYRGQVLYEVRKDVPGAIRRGRSSSRSRRPVKIASVWPR